MKVVALRAGSPTASADWDASDPGERCGPRPLAPAAMLATGGAALPRPRRVRTLEPMFESNMACVDRLTPLVMGAALARGQGFGAPNLHRQNWKAAAGQLTGE